MAEHMKFISSLSTELTSEERNLFAVAYKNVVGSRRGSWRKVISIEQSEAPKRNAMHTTLTKAYRHKIEGELRVICADVFAILDAHLATSSESKVWYHKTRGDYWRYIAEFAAGEERTHATQNGLSAYQRAYDIALSELTPINPTRLGLVLNLAVFYADVLGSRERACQIAKAAFDGAIADYDRIPEDLYKDTTIITNIMRDNLIFWTSETESDEGKGEKETKTGN